MIPTIAPSVLEANPQFASLHKHIISNILNHDASTRTNTKAQEQVSQRLHEHLLRVAKEELLRSSLSNVTVESQEKADKNVIRLSPELREWVGTMCMLLEGAPRMTLSEDDYSLLRPDIQAFHDKVNDIVSAVGQNLQYQQNVLCKVAAAVTAFSTGLPSARYPGSSKRLHQSTLPPSSSAASTSATSLSNLLRPLISPTTSDPTLQTALLTLSNTTIDHVTTYRTLLNTTITHLERTTHGLETRHLKAYSAHLSAVASGLAARIQVQYLQSRNKLYRPEVQTALGNYQRHLEALETVLEDRESELRGMVEEYEDVGVADSEVQGEGQRQRGLMREVGRRYGEVLSEVEKVKGQILRLETAGDESETARGGLAKR